MSRRWKEPTPPSCQTAILRLRRRLRGYRPAFTREPFQQRIHGNALPQGFGSEASCETSMLMELLVSQGTVRADSASPLPSSPRSAGVNCTELMLPGQYPPIKILSLPECSAHRERTGG